MSFYERAQVLFQKELNDRFMELEMYGRTKVHINMDQIRAQLRQEQFNQYLTEIENYEN